MRLKLAALIFLWTVAALGQGYKASEAVGRMSLADGFKAQLVASEPTIVQPVCIEFDERGRLWVIQYLQYPNPSGLNRATVDRFSRTKYDKVPDPPPRGPKGADRITILSGFDSNGHARHAKDFASGLNLASGLAFGRGGVFVLQVPYLLFYPDKDGDDVPDSDPEVLLTGFGMEDAHSVANSLIFGPDGWLYGCQGSTVTANIRGIEFQQGVWRYEPISKRFELFCEGGGNSWGLDFDEDGNLIYSTNLGPYRNLHGVQGGYYWKSFGKHGALHNPYTYGYFDHIPYQNFTGGHVTDGGIIYQGDLLPAQFRGQYMANDLLGHAVQWHRMEKSGSTFQASFGGALLTANDDWFAPSDLTMGPDGAIYVADWSDKRTAHPDPDADWDRSNGRIYRISYGTDPVNPPIPLEELNKLPSEKLTELLSDRNNWFVRKARGILANRRDAAIYPTLRARVFETKDEHLALECFWALYVSGGADEAFLNKTLDHSSPKIRFWAARFLGDQPAISESSGEHLVKVATAEADVRVRSQLASTAKRISAESGLAIAHTIALRDLDLNDPHIPLLTWWAVENHCMGAIDKTLGLFAGAKAWKSPMVRSAILPRLMRRYAAEGSEKTLTACARILETSPDSNRHAMLESLEQGFREQSRDQQVLNLEKVPAPLRQQLSAMWKDDIWDAVLISLLARLGSRPAVERSAALARDASAAAELRIAMIQVMGNAGTANGASVLLELSGPRESEAIQLAALEALGQTGIASLEPVLRNYPNAKPRVRSKARDLFFSRKEWTKDFLTEVSAKKFPSDDVPLDQLQKIALLKDSELDRLVRKLWGNIGGGTPEEKLADIRRFNNDLRAFPGYAAAGRQIYVNLCAGCHELFGEGEKVGPELTHANRADKDFLLTSIVDPNAVVRKEFISFNIETKDGSMVRGLVAEQTPANVTLVAAKNERTVIPRERIAAMQESTVSLMPEGLLSGLKPQELRDLFSYLQSQKKPLAFQPSK